MIPFPCEIADGETLRAQLLDADAMQRVRALHALELALAQPPAPLRPGLRREIEQFVERGIPYFAPEDSHYLGWVEKAASHWARLHHQPANDIAAAAARPAA